MIKHNDKWYRSYDWIKRFDKNEYDSFKNILIKQLQTITKICDEYNVKYWLDCGTLLGLYRQNDLLNPEYDNDIGIYIDDLNIEFLSKLKYLGLFKEIKVNPMFFKYDEIVDIIQNKNTDSYFYNRSIKIQFKNNDKFFGNKISPQTDIIIWYRKDDIQYSTIGSKLTMVQKTEYIEDRKILNTKYGEFYIPKYPEKYLSDMYGDDWNIPKCEHYDQANKVRGLFLTKNIGKITYNLKNKDLILTK